MPKLRSQFLPSSIYQCELHSSKFNIGLLNNAFEFTPEKFITVGKHNGSMNFSFLVGKPLLA